MNQRPTALVTGGSRGIGRAICERLSQEGVAVVVNYSSRPDAAADVCRAIEKAKGAAAAIQANVAESEDRARLIEGTLDHFGRLDLLVNNAGIASPGRLDLLEATEANWDSVLSTN